MLAMIPTDMIEVGTRLRGVKQEKVEAIIASVAEVGILNPVTVYKRKVIRDHIAVEGYGLIAGLHRLEAARQTGLAELPAQIVELSELQRQIAECDENLCGPDLTPSERALFTRRRKEAYEALHPEAKHGGDRGNQHTGGKPSGQVGHLPPKSFAEDQAEKTGQSPRAVRRDAERGEKIAPDVLAMLTPHKVSGTILDQIKRMPVEQQRQWAADYIAQQAAPKPTPASTAKKQAKAAETKSLKEEANEKLAQLFADHIPGEHWDALKANLYAAGAKDIAREFERLTGVSVFDNSRSGRAA